MLKDLDKKNKKKSQTTASKPDTSSASLQPSSAGTPLQAILP